MQGIISSASLSATFSLVRLTRLMGDCHGDPSIVVGIIDGPIDISHPAFSELSFRGAKSDQPVACDDPSSVACSHGTAIAGILCAKRGSPTPALCPSCTFLFYPLFPETPHDPNGMTSVTPNELSRAIVEMVNAGAMIINLSLGVIPADTSADRELDEACEHAARRGVLLIAAAGNQGRLGFQPLINHPWVIPVVSCDLTGGVAPESNLSPTIGMRGLRAPGVNIMTTAPNGNYAPISGSSAAAAIVTGSIALLWSISRTVSALGLRASILQSRRRERRSLIPPLLDVESVSKRLQTSISAKEIDMSAGTDKAQAQTGRIPPFVSSGGEIVQDGLLGSAKQFSHTHGRVISQTVPCPTCATGEIQNSGPLTFVFAIGQVRMRFPSPSIEKEFAQSIANGNTARLTDEAVLFNALRENSYLANEVCWILAVDGIETYILVPRDQNVLNQLVDAISPSEPGLDTDVIIGTRGPMAPPEMCNGLVAPIVLVDRVFSFQKPELMDALRRPEDSEMSDEEFRRSSDALFERILQISDNVGATDEHRAINYLAVRYDQIYTHTAAMFAGDFSLTRVDVMPSRLSGTRKLVNVIFTYTNRKTDVDEKYRVRVDVTEKFPFLEKRLSPYFEVE